MARRKKTAGSTKTTTAAKVKPQANHAPLASLKERAGSHFTDYFRFGESYTSLLLGILVVVITSILLLSIVHKKSIHRIQQTSSISTQRVVNKRNQNEHILYTVKSGDSLWTISEQEYKSGYKWVDIATANNLANPGMINAGNVLIIPSVSPKMDVNAGIAVTPEVTPVQTQLSQAMVSGKISGKTYTVEKGDYLWKIAVRAYGDGYKWVDIARANNLTNPNLIFSGNVLTIPRQ